MNRARFPKETRIHKNGEIHELFVLALSLVWFAGATPDPYLQKICPQNMPYNGGQSGIKVE